jgi:hypothetical protein
MGENGGFIRYIDTLTYHRFGGCHPLTELDTLIYALKPRKELQHPCRQVNVKPNRVGPELI